jgi:hypothetical protein
VGAGVGNGNSLVGILLILNGDIATKGALAGIESETEDGEVRLLKFIEDATLTAMQHSQLSLLMLHRLFD